MKITPSYKNYYFFAILAFSCFAAQAELTGLLRDNFIDSFAKSCFKTQRSAAANKNNSDKILNQYCKCNSTYMANSLNNSLARSIENGEQQLNPNMLQLAANYCNNNYNKY